MNRRGGWQPITAGISSAAALQARIATMQRNHPWNPPPPVQCASCDDTGWVQVSTDQLGRARVDRCRCRQNVDRTHHIEAAQIEPLYRHCTLDNFETYGNETLIEALRQARHFCERFPAVEPRGLLLHGDVAVGKTHLATAILRRCLERTSCRGLFHKTSELLAAIRATYNPIGTTAVTESELLRRAQEVECLVLDDVGVEKPSDWVDKTLELIVDHRYSHQRSTIITTNCLDTPDKSDPHGLSYRVGSRIESRLQAMCTWLVLDAANYRERPVNATEDDLRRMWQDRKQSKLVIWPHTRGGNR